MRSHIARIFIAILVAAATPATLFTLPEWSLPFTEWPEEHLFKSAIGIWIIAFVIALAHAVILGLPAYFILKKKNLIGWWVSILAGFVIGSLPIGIFSWPYDPKSGNSFSRGEGGKLIPEIVHGVPTYDGWISYLDLLILAGGLGAAGAFMAWLVWKKLSPKTEFAYDPA